MYLRHMGRRNWKLDKTHGVAYGLDPNAIQTKL